MMYITAQLSRMWTSDSHQVLDEDLSTLLVTTWSLPSSETLWGIPQVPSPDHLPLWCGWGPPQSDPGAVADQCMGLPTSLLPPGGGAVGVVYGWSKVRRMISTHLPVFVCMLCKWMSVFYLWKKSIAVECIAVVSHFFDLTHISTCSCQSHWIAHNTPTTRTYIHVDIGAHVVWMFGGRGWPTPCLVWRVPLSTSSTLPPPSSRCLHSDPEEQWLVSSEATLHLVLAGGVCGVCVWAAIKTWPLH